MRMKRRCKSWTRKRTGRRRTVTCGRMSAEKPRATAWSASTASPDGRHATRMGGWSGTLLTDGYAAYRTLKNGGSIINAGCWAHVRRDFAALYKVNRNPHAGMALKMIHGLYSLEKKIRHRSPEKIRQWRQRYARPQLDTLWSWLTA